MIISHFLKLGASFLTKNSNEKEIKAAIEAVSNGTQYLQSKLEKGIANSDGSTLSSKRLKLGPQEKKLILLLQEGKSSKEIAGKMGLTFRTVRTYRERILEKTKTKNVAELMSFEFKTGLIS